jgi:hypothetical protein
MMNIGPGIYSAHCNYRYMSDELPRSKLRGISLEEFIDLTEASFEEFDPERLNLFSISCAIFRIGRISLSKVKF